MEYNAANSLSRREAGWRQASRAALTRANRRPLVLAIVGLLLMLALWRAVLARE